MGGSINIVMKGFAGVNIMKDRIKIDPNLPKNWNSIALNFRFRKSRIYLFMTKQNLSIRVGGSKDQKFALPVEVYGKTYRFSYGKTHGVSLKKGIKIMKWGARLKVIQEKRVLIVEGDVALAERVKMKLESAGCLVDYVATAGGALRVLKEEWVDLIVMSVVLQGQMHGYKLLKDIKSKKAYRKIPVIVQTSRVSMEDTFKNMGVELFLPMPYSVSSAVEKIKSILSK